MHLYAPYGCNEVYISHHVMIGPAVQIYTTSHHLQAETRNQGWELAKPIVIEDNVWIGAAPSSCQG